MPTEGLLHRVHRVQSRSFEFLSTTVSRRTSVCRKLTREGVHSRASLRLLRNSYFTAPRFLFFFLFPPPPAPPLPPPFATTAGWDAKTREEEEGPAAAEVSEIEAVAGGTSARPSAATFVACFSTVLHIGPAAVGAPVSVSALGVAPPAPLLGVMPGASSA